MFDNKANLITDPDFIEADNLDDSKYKGVTMGRKEGEVMKDLIYKHGFFKRKENIDFQGVCYISPKARKVGVLVCLFTHCSEFGWVAWPNGLGNNLGCLVDTQEEAFSFTIMNLRALIKGAF